MTADQVPARANWNRRSIKQLIQADAYFFDIDGTLLITRDGVHRNALHRAMLEVYGVNTTIDGIAYHGKTDLGILRAALDRCGVDSATFDRGLAAALKAICRVVAENSVRMRPEVFPAVPEILSEIQGQNKLLGVASGNLESVGWTKIRAAGLRSYFSMGSFADACEMRTAVFDAAATAAKESLGKNARICFVGDTPEDIQAAKAVNAGVVAVCTGIFPKEQLAALNPDLCCSSCEELIGKLH